MKPGLRVASVMALAWLGSVGTPHPTDPKQASAPRIYPSGPTIPENLLRIELRFEAPLSGPFDVTRLHLLGPEGEIAHPFLDLALPSRSGERVTVLLDPSRVKSGTRGNVEAGRALHAGSMVTLVIDDPEIGEVARKTWSVDAADTDGPHPEAFGFDPPFAGSRAPLLVGLGAPISSAAEFLIAVRGSDGCRVAGAVSLEDHESKWRFEPDAPWSSGRYALVVHPDLEDPAGNRAGAPFEGVGVASVGGDYETVLPFEPVWPLERDRKAGR